MVLFKKKKIDRLNEIRNKIQSQIGVNPYGVDGEFNNEGKIEINGLGYMLYSAWLPWTSKKEDNIVIVNRYQNKEFKAKEWYLYNDKNGWAKIGTLDAQQCLYLYKETFPYTYEKFIKKYGTIDYFSEIDFETEICTEYFSTYMIERYFGISINNFQDRLRKHEFRGEQAIYMPHPISKSAYIQREKEFESQDVDLIAELAEMINEEES